MDTKYLEIIKAPVKQIEWSDGKAKKQPIMRDNLELWTGCDFYLYAEKLYIDKYGESICHIKLFHEKQEMNELKN